MALVNLTNIVVLDNPTSFTNPFIFEVTFECVQELADDLEWKVVYVSSAEDAERDQTLEEVMVGPVPVGVNKFVLQSDAPDVQRIPKDDIVGVTVILITCSYREQEFVRVGYYVNNECQEDYDPEHPPAHIDISALIRNILADKPRVTRFVIDWGLGVGTEGAGEGGERAEEEDDGGLILSGEAGAGVEYAGHEEEDVETESSHEGSVALSEGGGAADMEIASPRKNLPMPMISSPSPPITRTC